MKTTFATNLTRARTKYGLTMEELANAINLSKQAIGNYESGLRTPDSATLSAIAKILCVDLEFFYTTLETNFKLHDINYREGMLLTPIQRLDVEAKTNSQLTNYIELEYIAKEKIEFQNPLEDLIVSNVNDAEKAAKQLRKKWKLGEGPLYNITNFLERKAIRIIKIDFGFNHEHEGLSGWAENKIPVIILNARKKDTARLRFTILHELGHLLLIMEDNLSIDLIERICDAFAGAVLLPAEVLVQEFGRNRTAISMSELRRIKETYGVSIAAIMVRALKIQLIDLDSYMKWKKSDFSNFDFGQYNYEEEPQRFMQLLYRCLSEKLIGFDKAAYLSERDEQVLREEYFTQQLEFE